MIINELSLNDFVAYGVRCLSLSKNATVGKLEYSEKADILLSLGLGMLYETLYSLETLEEMQFKATDIPYPRLYKDLHNVLEVSPEYLEHPVLAELYASKQVIVLCDHDLHAYLSAIVNNSKTLYCIGCRQIHLRSTEWFEDHQLVSKVEAAYCRKHVTYNVPHVLKNTRH